MTLLTAAGCGHRPEAVTVTPTPVPAPTATRPAGAATNVPQSAADQRYQDLMRQNPSIQPGARAPMPKH